MGFFILLVYIGSDGHLKFSGDIGGRNILAIVTDWSLHVINKQTRRHLDNIY